MPSFIWPLPKGKEQTGSHWSPLSQYVALDMILDKNDSGLTSQIDVFTLQRSLYWETCSWSLSIYWLVTLKSCPHTACLILLWPKLSHLIFECRIIHLHFQTNLSICYVLDNDLLFSPTKIYPHNNVIHFSFIPHMFIEHLLDVKDYVCPWIKWWPNQI